MWVSLKRKHNFHFFFDVALESMGTFKTSPKRTPKGSQNDTKMVHFAFQKTPPSWKLFWGVQFRKKSNCGYLPHPSSALMASKKGPKMDPSIAWVFTLLGMSLLNPLEPSKPPQNGPQKGPKTVPTVSVNERFCRIEGWLLCVCSVSHDYPLYYFESYFNANNQNFSGVSNYELFERSDATHGYAWRSDGREVGRSDGRRGVTSRRLCAV